MQYRHLLFIDIETVAENANFDMISDRLQSHWKYKTKWIHPGVEEPDYAQLYKERAGIYAEFGKIVCIGMGVFYPTPTGSMGLRVRSLYGEDEKALLQSFADLLKQNAHLRCLVAHNGKEFDFPYLCRRMLVHQIVLPTCLRLSGKKPWEVQHIDTLELWKFGDKKHYTSLDLLASLFGIPSSKSNLQGDMVYETFYQQKNVKAIAQYCQEDVVVLAQLYLKLEGMECIPSENILHLEQNEISVVEQASDGS